VTNSVGFNIAGGGVSLGFNDDADYGDDDDDDEGKRVPVVELWNSGFAVSYWYGAHSYRCELAATKSNKA